MRTAKTPSALILANGFSGMDQLGNDVLPNDDGAKNPALARFRSGALLGRHVASFRSAGIRNIAVVRRAGVSAVATSPGNVKLVLPAEERAGDFEALVLGLFALDAAPVLVMPVMNEVVEVETLSLLLSMAESTPSSESVGEKDERLALVPRFHGKSGHPVVLTRAGVAEVVLDQASSSGMHALDRLLSAWGQGVQAVDVSDESVVTLVGACWSSMAPRA